LADAGGRRLSPIPHHVTVSLTGETVQVKGSSGVRRGNGLIDLSMEAHFQSSIEKSSLKDVEFQWPS
jgi:hypothetical protein